MSEAHEDEYDAVIPGAGSATEHDAVSSEGDHYDPYYSGRPPQEEARASPAVSP